MKSSNYSRVAAGVFCLSVLASRTEAATATIDVKTWHQKISGFGTCSAWNGAMSSTEAQELWDTAKGAGLSLHRVQIQANATIEAGETTDLKWCKQYGVTAWGTPWYALNATKLANYDTLYESNMQAWADALAGMANSLKQAGTPLYAISSQNEPDIGWTAYNAATLALWVGKYLGPTMASKAPDTKVMGTETCNWYGFSSYEPVFKSNANAWKYSSILATHEYGGTVKAYPEIQAAGKEFWETEKYDDNTSSEDPGMGSGLRIAALIHAALTVANMNAWHYWWIKPCNNCYNGALWAQSTNQPTKRLWVMGNFSRFVRPGFVRIDGTVAPTSGVTLSAYRDSALTKVVVVAINTNTGSTSQTFAIPGVAPSKVTPWITDATRNIVADPSQTLASSSFTYSLPATSVTTLVFDIPPTTGLAGVANRMVGNLGWSAGRLTVPGMKDGRVQIIDMCGRSRTVDLVDGHAVTGPLPSGIYKARLEGSANTATAGFIVSR